MINYDILLSKAIIIAASVHKEQKDKGGDDYILHPLRVMMNFTDQTHRIVAVLHDAIEDSESSFEINQISEFPGEVVDAVVLLTRNKEDKYLDYIKKISTNPIAMLVKLADLTDNMDISRIKNKLTNKDLERLNKYRKAYDYLINTSLQKIC